VGLAQMCDVQPQYTEGVVGLAQMCDVQPQYTEGVVGLAQMLLKLEAVMIIITKKTVLCDVTQCSLLLEHYFI
jgi:hypothetical protein